MKYFLIALIFLGLSCTKERSCENCGDDTIYKNATVIYGGPIQGDGCDWLIKVDDTHTYHPDVLSVAFQQDQLPVKINYELTADKFICGIGNLQITIIHIKDIRL